ncbi:MAG: SOSS complex subunit B family protein [Nanoarchaeota archaeon]
MQVKDLKPRQGSVDIVLDITSIEPPREFQKFGKPGRVANAKGMDGTGEIKVTLWNEDIDNVKTGDKIQITNGYVNEWQGELQLTTGRLGKLEVIGKASADAVKEEAPEIKSNSPLQDFDENDDVNVEEEDIEDEEI